MISNTKSTGESQNEETTAQKEDSSTQKGSKSKQERMSLTLKRYKEFKKGRDTQIRKKMKLSNAGSSDDNSSESDIDSTRTSGAQRGNLRLQKEKIKEVGNSIKKWRAMKNRINGKK